MARETNEGDKRGIIYMQRAYEKMGGDARRKEMRKATAAEGRSRGEVTMKGNPGFILAALYRLMYCAHSR